MRIARRGLRPADCEVRIREVRIREVRIAGCGLRGAGGEVRFTVAYNLMTELLNLSREPNVFVQYKQTVDSCNR